MLLWNDAGFSLLLNIVILAAIFNYKTIFWAFMCGFVGFLGGGTWKKGVEVTQSVLANMADAIFHRGPDGHGFWYDSDSLIAFGHRRLAILDLSDAGRQPMISRSGRYVLAFNGEIYNHLELRNELDLLVYEKERLNSSNSNPKWKGHSDTETLLAGFDLWGIDDTVTRASGMFAIAVWDRQERTLTLGRDRLGEKPIYYGWQGLGEERAFLFASELKAFKKHPSFSADIDRGALCEYMRYGCVPAPYSIYTGISKLPPGCLATLSLSSADILIRSYWSGVEVSTQGVKKPIVGSTQEVIESLDGLLKDAVSKQMISDVPLGAFLSGGIDSSTIVALMQAQSAQPVKTFSIGFSEDVYNEAEYAKAIANYLGTDHTELYISPQDAMAIIPSLPSIYDEPFSDSSQIPTCLVSQLARKHVTVSLSGDGGDELFCGYNRYQFAAGLWQKMSRIPLSMRKFLGGALTKLSPADWSRLALALGDIERYYPNIGDKIHKVAAVMASNSLDDLYLGIVSHWKSPESLVIGGYEPVNMLSGIDESVFMLDDVQRMMLFDMLSYLPNDVLTKVDRAAMSVSLETRVPFLDHRVVQFAWALPLDFKLRDGLSKWVLRQVLYKYVPSHLIDRPKMGFGVPIDVWLRGPLRDWAEDLISEERLTREGYFQPKMIRDKWMAHLNNRGNNQNQLWDVLMFQAWLEGARHE